MEALKCLEFPNREFKTQEDLFMTLKEHESDLIRLKKARGWEAREKGQQMSVLDADAVKLLTTIKAFNAEPGFVYPVISSTRFMDSHKDVHFDGCFNRTLDRQKGKVSYILDHDMSYDNIIAWPEDVEMFKAMLDWNLVGKNYSGQTEALLFKIAEDKFKRQDVLQDIKTRMGVFENSIRMNYHDVFLAINSKNPDLKQNKTMFDSYISQIANKELAYEVGHFYGVKALEINKEGSLVVAGGSNSATSILIPEPVNDPSEQNKIDPLNGPQSKSVYDIFLN